MKKLIPLLIVFMSVGILNAQTLRMTAIHIEEEKELSPRNNHIVYGVGVTPYPFNGETRTDCILMLGYYKTDILLENKLGLYMNLTLSTNQGGLGITGGATYKYIESGDNTLYFIGGLGLARYLKETKSNYGNYYIEDYYTSLRIEGGILYNYKRLDLRATVGVPDYLSFGIGYRFGFNF